MKRYTVPFARVKDFQHPAPERTARKSGATALDDDMFQVWPSRAAMLASIEMQSKGRALRPWRPLTGGSNVCRCGRSAGDWQFCSDACWRADAMETVEVRS